MESREQNLIIINRIATEGELAQHPIIQIINRIIEYINKNRFRQQNEKDDEYQKQNPQATLSQDIQLREQIAISLSQPANLFHFMDEVKSAIQKKYSSDKERANHLAKFEAMIDKFTEMAMPNGLTFVHLTAVELANIGAALDNLLVLLHKVCEAVSEDAAFRIIVNKQAEIVKIRDKVSACMAYHQDTFKQFHSSDIILNFFDEIETISGINMAKERKGLWPDRSYQYDLPELPLIKKNENRQTVAEYFSGYIQSTPPGSEDINHLTDEVKYELSVLDAEKQNQKKGKFAEPDQAASRWICWPSLFRYKAAKKENEIQIVANVTDRQDNLVEESKTSLADELVLAENVVKLFESSKSKNDRQLAELQLNDELRKEIIHLRDLLDGEIKELLEPGCFSCFYTGTLRKKLAKKTALEQVLDASTLRELGQRARKELSGPNHKLVCAGLNSRTEALLTRLADVAQQDLTSLDDLDLTFDVESDSEFYM